MADWNQGGIALTAAGGIFRHNQTQSATTRTSVTPSTTTTYTPPSSPTMGGGGY